MTWREFQASAVEALENATDLAVLRLRLRTEKTRLRSAYEDFGEVAYLSFVSDDESGADALAEYIKAITLIREQIAALEQQIAQQSQSQGR